MKPSFTREELQGQIDSGLSCADISRESGVPYRTVYKWVKRYGILSMPKDRIRRDELARMYRDERLTLDEIAAHFDTSEQTVISYLKKFGITREKKKVFPASMIEKIKAMYVDDGMTLLEIARSIGSSGQTVARNLRASGVDPNVCDSHRMKTEYRDPRILRALYVDQELSTVDIAKVAGTDKANVSRWLKEAGIEIRSQDERFEIIRRTGKCSREKNPSWSGGFTISPQGYRLIKNADHPMADARGYVAEHIAIATSDRGGILADGELVHHIDMDQLNNNPDNLAVMTRSAHRHAHHELEVLAAHFVRSGAIAFQDGHYKLATEPV